MGFKTNKPLTDEELAALYFEGVGENLQTLEGYLARLKEDPACLEAVRSEMRQILHDVKGQGTSFGFPLMTEIGESCYRLVRYGEAGDEKFVKILEAHLTAMQTVIDNKIHGEGPDLVRDVVKGLKERVELAVCTPDAAKS